MSQSRNQVRFWSVYSRVYDGLLDFAPYVELVGDVTSALELASGASVVDLGCGTGNYLAAVASGNPQLRKLTGVDSSPHMLGNAKAKLAGDSRVSFVEGNILDWLDSADRDAVDAAFSVNVLYTMGSEDRRRFFEGLSRVLSPTGAAVVVTSDRAGFGHLLRCHIDAKGWRGWFHLRLLAVLLMNLVIWVFERGDSYDPVPATVLASEAEAAGLRVVGQQRCYGGTTDGVDVMLILELADPALV